MRVSSDGPSGMGQATGSVSCPLGGMGQIPVAACDGVMAGAGGEQVFAINLPDPAALSVALTSDFDATVRLTTSACDLGTVVGTGPGDDGCACA